MDDTRQSWDEYFLGLAEAVSTRSTCTLPVGAVIVRDRHIISTGYAGGPSGMAHCSDVGCTRGTGDPGDGGGCIAIHAEANALLFCGPGQRQDASLYSTAVPCFSCAKLLANSGLGEVVAGGDAEDWTEVRDFLRTAGVRVRLSTDPAQLRLVGD